MPDLVNDFKNGYTFSSRFLWAFAMEFMAPTEQIHQAALDLWRDGTNRLLGGDVHGAIDCFRRSLMLHPTAESHTYLGWAYSYLGRLADAVRECEKAIEVDPEYGNAYNDLGCYRMQQGRSDEAADWFERAKTAPRYEPRHFPFLNLGRLRLANGELAAAMAEFQQALEIRPNDPVALTFLEAFRSQVN